MDERARPGRESWCSAQGVDSRARRSSRYDLRQAIDSAASLHSRNGWVLGTGDLDKQGEDL